MLLPCKPGSRLDGRPAPLTDDRIIFHFDYDCFYASVFEAETPALRSLPLAVQQKQILVTCNYEARRRGLHKLQLITEARRICPDVIIVLGEDLSRFRAASKTLYAFLSSFLWSKRSERLGFDEVSLDVTDMIDFNLALVNRHDPANCFFNLDRKDPTVGFAYDASQFCGHAFPEQQKASVLEAGSRYDSVEDLSRQRLILASHLARHLRHRLENDRGYTATVGISINKLLAKLVGSTHKPNQQTLLLPPYFSEQDGEMGNATRFMDDHEIGKIPGIGFKLAQKIRRHVLGRDAAFDQGLVYGGTKEQVSVRDVRLTLGMGPTLLEEILGGPGSPRGIGMKIWSLIHGVDDSEVAKQKLIPTQISLEDSYLRLETMEEVRKELVTLSTSLLKRLHLDLTDMADKPDERQWLAIPQTLRLTTRPKSPMDPDGRRSRSFNRISRSRPMPTFVLSKENTGTIAHRLVRDALLPMFEKLHPENTGWNLSLMNVAATNMQETANGESNTSGRDIGRMFKQQKEVLKEWKVEDVDVPPEMAEESHSVMAYDQEEDHSDTNKNHGHEGLAKESLAAKEGVAVTLSSTHMGSEDSIPFSQSSYIDGDAWESEGDQDPSVIGEACSVCGALMPAFAVEAHHRYHTSEDD